MTLEYEKSIEGVYNYLRSVSMNENIIEQLRHYLELWDYKSTRRINSFHESIEQATDELIDIAFQNNKDEIIHNCLRSFVHFEIYDHISSLIKKKFAKDDLNLYNISKEFCKNNGRPKEFGDTVYNFIPRAAVVELSMLNSKRTPMEKLICLSSTYDNIYAEVKGALISIISKYSDKEIDLPLINNKDVIPILAAVILKSRLFYFLSDMYYIAQFGSDTLKANRNLGDIYNAFKDSLEKIISRSPASGSHIISIEKLEDNLSVCDTIDFIEKVCTDKSNDTVFEEEKNRVASLIITATTHDL